MTKKFLKSSVDCIRHSNIYCISVTRFNATMIKEEAPICKICINQRNKERMQNVFCTPKPAKYSTSCEQKKQRFGAFWQINVCGRFDCKTTRLIHFLWLCKKKDKNWWCLVNILLWQFENDSLYEKFRSLSFHLKKRFTALWCLSVCLQDIRVNTLLKNRNDIGTQWQKLWGTQKGTFALFKCSISEFVHPSQLSMAFCF